MSTFVIAVVGTSPAVVTELLWWLVAHERRPVPWVEIWTTTVGAAALRALLQSPAWTDLQRQTGPLPSLIDPPPTQLVPGITIRVFPDELSDIRTPEQAEVVSATLHDRVRALRTALPKQIRLVGSLAGGRKTMSVALQTAFSMQAGLYDELVHVLLHPDLEAALRSQGSWRDYQFPSAEWEAASGVPAGDQVRVYQVPFPKLRYLVGDPLRLQLDNKPWSEVWPELTKNMRRELTAHLFRPKPHSDLRFEIRDAQSDEPCFGDKLPEREGAIFAAMIGAERPTGSADLLAWIREHRPTPWNPAGGSPRRDRSYVRKGVRALRGRFRGRIPAGMTHLGPPDKGYDVTWVDMDLSHPSLDPSTDP